MNDVVGLASEFIFVPVLFLFREPQGDPIECLFRWHWGWNQARTVAANTRHATATIATNIRHSSG